jgi:hypothetical protein
MKTRTNPLVAQLAHQLDLAFDVRSWHGPNLMGSLRGVTPEEAVWRPQPDRHNIAELLVHAAYWKSRVCRLIAAVDVPPFDLPGSDFFERAHVPTRAEWQDDLDLLRRWHATLKALVLATEPSRLDAPTSAGKFTVAEVIAGAAAHDLYHAGQIRLLRRMYDDV